MLFQSEHRETRREGFRQGMWTSLLIASPFILAGVKWMMENRESMTGQLKKVKKSDLYTQMFDKDSYSEKMAGKKLETFRSEEGNFSKSAESSSSDEDKELFHMIREITKNELSKEKESGEQS